MDSLLTVTVPAADRKLTTAAALRTELGVSSSEASDSRLEDLIDRASRAIDSYCARVLASETVAEVFRSTAAWSCRPYERRLMLPLTRYPVSSITSVTEDGAALTVNTDYEADLVTGRLYRLSGDTRIAWSGAKTTVVYVAGYTVPTGVPGDLAAAAIKLASGFYAGADRDPLIKGESADGIGSVEYWVGGMPGSSGDLPPDVTALLDPYRLLVV